MTAWPVRFLGTVTGDGVGEPASCIGHELHDHAAHGAAILCSCGRISGTYSTIPPDEPPPPCPECARLGRTT